MRGRCLRQDEQPGLPLHPEEMQKRTDDILAQMDEKGISDKKLRKEVGKVKEESVLKMKEYEEKLETVGERGSYSKTDKDATFMRMKSELVPTEPSQTYPIASVVIYKEKGDDLISHPLLVF